MVFFNFLLIQIPGSKVLWPDKYFEQEEMQLISSLDMVKLKCIPQV